MEKRLNLLKSGSGYLARRNIDSCLGESEIFLSHTLNCHRLELYLEDLSVEQKEADYFWRLLTARASGFPLQYLLGSTEFMGLRFKVAPGVFIPRPETEILVESTVNILSNKQTNRKTEKQTILDIGTGCGNIAVSLAKYLKDTHIFACDISDFALRLAKENSFLNKVNVSFVKGNLFSAFKKQNFFSLILSNPPYIKTPEIPALPRELEYEPTQAYDGGRDGLFYYRRIISQAPDYLQERGLLILELADNQANSVKNILIQSARFSVLKVVRDYNDVQRVMVAEKQK